MIDLDAQMEQELRTAMAYARTMDAMLTAIFPTIPKRIEESTEQPQPQKDTHHDRTIEGLRNK